MKNLFFEVRRVVFAVALAGIVCGPLKLAAQTDDAIRIDVSLRERCVTILRDGLLAGDFWPAMHAAEGLTLGGHGSEVIAMLEPRLAFETDDQRRCGLAREIVRAGDRTRATIMLEILAGENPHGHVHAAESLYKVGESGDCVALRSAFRGTSDLRLKLMAAAALGRTGDTETLAFIRSMISHDDPESSRVAVWILGRIGTAIDIPRIRANIDRSPDMLARAYHDHSLAALGDPGGIASLLNNLQSDDAAVRTYAAVFAGDARVLAATPLLTKLLDDQTTDVRVRAAQSLLVLSQPTASAADLTVLRPTDGEPPANRIVYEHLAAEAQMFLKQRRLRFEQLTTMDDCLEWQSQQRKFFESAIGGFPERTPLNARVVGTLDGGNYAVEKIIYESRPQHHVTATLYRPKSAAPWPGVLIACGHTKSGKAAEYNQRMGILLAKNGMAAFCYDPIGQGERSQVLTDDGHARHASSTTEHFLVGIGSILTGTSTAQYRIWDGIRGIDYLCRREDIRADGIGCTGCSGGGTLTSYIMALDDRVVCAAPACYLTTFSHLIDSLGPQDAEQNIFDQLRFGMDHSDYVLMRAPRPTLICCTTDDYFSVQGTWDTFRQAKRFYQTLGHAERVDLFEGPGKHGVARPSREALTRWMRRWLLNVDDAITESDFDVWSEPQLNCTPTGQVLQLPGERTVFDLNGDRSDALRQARSEFDRLAPNTARELVRHVTGIRTLAELPLPRIQWVGDNRSDRARIRKLVLERESGVRLPALRFVPDQPSAAAYLVLDGSGKSAAAATGGLAQELFQQGHDVLAIDLHAIGELRGNNASDHLGDWRDFFMAYLTGRSIVQLRTEDILNASRWLATENSATSRPVHLITSGEATVAALHAAALEPDLIRSIRLVDGAIPDWDQITRASDPTNELINTIHGVLRHYDLPALQRLAGDVRAIR